MTPRRKPTNLTLSDETLKMAETLMASETRPSLSNLVEALVVREHQRLSTKSQRPARRARTTAPASEVAA
jgi:hypothetical protein